MKTDAKFYAIHVSPSEKELRAMGNSEQEQAEAMKHKDLINCSATIANKSNHSTLTIL